jgi:hypothetical protein
MDFLELMPNYSFEDIMRLNDPVFINIYKTGTFKKDVYFDSFFDNYFDIVKLKSYTDSIGNTICAFLNTKGGVIRIECKENENADVIKNRLKNLYMRFNYDPVDWISVRQSEQSKFVFLLVEPKDKKVKVYEFDGKVYYREKNKNRILANGDTNIIIINKRAALGLPFFTEYAPTNPDKKIVFEDTKKKNNISYYRIGELPKNRSIFYKYISLDIALSIFRKEQDPKQIQELKNQGKDNPTQTIRFVEPSGWEDQYERRYYTADYKKLNISRILTPKLYATCFTTQKESEPAWQIYTRGKDGLGERCVQFCINQVALREELVKNLRDCTIVEGMVKYLSTYEIDTYHLSTDKNGNPEKEYLKRFSNFTLENYINLLLLKRTAFVYENEVRFFIIDENDKTSKKSRKKEKAKHKDISLNWLSFLEGIKVDPKCSDIEIRLLQDEINRLIDDTVKEEDREELKKKLTITTYDVNKDLEGDQQLKIGETYKHFEERLLADSKKP